MFRNRIAQAGETQPRIFQQKAHRHVECRPAHISRLYRLCSFVRDEIGDRRHVVRPDPRAISDWCASRNVVSVIRRRFCDLVHSRIFGAELIQQLARTSGRILGM